MIRSMTGFGRASSTVNGMEITAEIKSVNHRYFEFSCRLSRIYGFLDDKLKQFIGTRVNRGKVELHLSINVLESENTLVSVNHALARGYAAALTELAETLELRPNFSTTDIARYPEVLSVSKDEEDEAAIWEAVSGVTDEALSAFIKMRELEGMRLKNDIFDKGNSVLSKVALVEELTPETVIAYREKLEQKVRDLLSDANVDEQRLLTETAIFADKIATDEETVRLKSHISQMFSMLESGESVGRKLDFLVQEINRETNTIGSKSNNVEITRIVVDIKSDVEKIREQIQNIE